MDCAGTTSRRGDDVTDGPGLDLAHILWLAILQGVTELFPISSLGHAALVPRLFGWALPSDDATVPLLVALHLGTAAALIVYFWRDWAALARGLWPAAATPETQGSRRLLLLLVVGTLPAGLLGLLLEKRLAALFGSIPVISLALILNGALLAVGELLRRRARRRTLDQLRIRDGVAIGLSQCLALIPGFSRSGATLVSGLLVGLSHESAGRFAFLLATPIILAAGVLELPKLLQPALRPALGPALAGGVVAGIVAWLSTAALMTLFRRREADGLLPFGLYCVVFGGLMLVHG
jgi:undecaprenyl-diphosphatase